MKTNKTSQKNVLIGLSWPYANARLHIGNVGSSLPADALARFHRLAGNDVVFVTGSDCYGTPILIRAMQEGIAPETLAQKYHEHHERDFARLGFTFDLYSKTTADYHKKFVMDWHTEMYGGDYIYEKAADQLYCESCKKYLPDRYVEGTCPHCRAPAKGDSCDICGKILEPEDLIEPKCKLCGGTPRPKNTTQLYLNLSALQSKLEKYYAEKSPNWAVNAQGMAGRYLKEGLRDRAITRNIEWGVDVPRAGWDDKRIYIWAENVLGYLSAAKEFCERSGRDWREFLLDDAKSDKLHYFVHGKDNIPFHTIILPGLMLANPAAKYHAPDIIASSEYGLLNGKKISKSAGNLITSEEMSDAFDPDLIRFYFLRNINDRKDINFTFEDFVNTVNGELINNFGNLVNRTLSFVHSKFGGVVKVFDVADTIRTQIKDTYKAVTDLMTAGKINAALKTAFELVNFGNKYFADNEPWKNPESSRKVIFEIITLIANIVKICEPFIPFSCAKVTKWLGIDVSPLSRGVADPKRSEGADGVFDYFVHKKDFKLPPVEILFKRLDMKEVREKFPTFFSEKT